MYNHKEIEKIFDYIHQPDVVVGVVLCVVVGVVLGVDGVLDSVVDSVDRLGDTASVLLATEGSWVVPT